MKASESSRKEVTEYLTYANYDQLFGNFEMNMEDGEVRYKYAVDCTGIDPSPEVIGRSMEDTVCNVASYGDGLLKVMSGMMSAEEAFKFNEESWRGNL